MRTEPFASTHRISKGHRRILVQVVDGTCYTRAEWDSGSPADWRVDLVA